MSDILSAVVEKIKSPKERKRLMVLAYESMLREQAEERIIKEVRGEGKILSDTDLDQAVYKRVCLRVQQMNEVVMMYNSSTPEVQAKMMILAEVVKPGILTTSEEIEITQKTTYRHITRKDFFEEYFPGIDSFKLYEEMRTHLGIAIRNKVN